MIRVGLGVQGFVSAGGVSDADAQAFINAAGITDVTQQSAINTLVTDLKGYGIWTKMKAIYPFVGGTSSTHRWNLRDPRDLNAAFRLAFNGGWTHSSNGALPNGTNGYADTFLNPDNTLTLNNTHLSFYSRTNSNGLFCDIGGTDNNVSFLPLFKIIPRYLGDFLGYSYSFQSGQFVQNAVADSNGLMLISRTSSTSLKSFKNGNVLGSTTTTQNQARILGRNVLIGASAAATISEYSNRQCAFASIGDGLTDTEAANFYISVQKFQTTLGRQVGVPIVADSDAQAFLNAAEITNQTQATAVNTLVEKLKTDGIWSKMRAIYPFVGGTASTHRWNLRDPRDLDAAFRLVFNGGWTHSSNGALPNGTNAFADTKLLPSSSLTNNNTHFSFYSRTSPNRIGAEIGAEVGSDRTVLHIRYSDGNAYSDMYNFSTARITASNSNGSGYYISTRTSGSVHKLFKNNSQLGLTNTGASGNVNNINRSVYLSFINSSGSPSIEYSNRECAFASIGDGLTDAEAANLYSAVQAFQTTLSRNV